MNNTKNNKRRLITTQSSNDIGPPNLPTQKIIKTNVNVDSRFRINKSFNKYGETVHLDPYSIEFQNNNSIIKIHLSNNPFNDGDKIILHNISSKNLLLKDILMIKKNSMFIRFLHRNHGMSIWGKYDPSDFNQFIPIEYVDFLPMSYDDNDIIPDKVSYYIWTGFSNISINVSGVIGLNSDLNFIGNIPINYLNSFHIVIPLFTKINGQMKQDPNSYLIQLDRQASINYQDGINTNDNQLPLHNSVNIQYNNLYGIPLKILNSEKILTIMNSTTNSIELNIEYPAIVDPINKFYGYDDFSTSSVDNINTIINKNHGGGLYPLIKFVTETIKGYPNPSQYTYNLGKNFTKVAQVRIISSIFPNSQKTINNKTTDVNNNKLYWRNLNDGNWIYQLSIEPGIYNLEDLKKSIENSFANTPFYQYTIEYQSNPKPNIVKDTMLLDPSKYDENGLYKFHIVNLDMVIATNEVIFSSFREIILLDQPCSEKVIHIPSQTLELTLNTNIQKINENIKYPFDKNTQILFIYLQNQNNYDKSNLYTYNQNILCLDEFKTIVNLDVDTNILINMTTNGKKYIYSINTNITLNNFNYDNVLNFVTKQNHNLKPGDIIITDKFIQLDSIGRIHIYEVTDIIDVNKFKVTITKDKYKFIINDLLIGFTDKPSMENNFVKEIVKWGNDNIMIINHPNHNLSVGDPIEISGSDSINDVPENIINRKHIISKIIDDNHYDIIIDKYVPIKKSKSSNKNSIRIKYPNPFQLIFSYDNTLGSLLYFRNVGTNDAITPYSSSVSNKGNYITELPHQRINNESTVNNSFGYYFIRCPQLTTYHNIGPVKDVFTKIQLTDSYRDEIFNSYVPTEKTFDPPLPKLSELEIEICNPNGKLIDFDGQNHSFDLEIIELSSDIPKINP